jgi:SAM-dependent methyltransferase
MTTPSNCDRSIEVSHYSGLAGERYYTYQSRDAEVMAKHIGRKFSRDVCASDVVIDFGCGGGFLLGALSCAQRLGIEINPAARRAAEANGLTCFESLDEIQDCTADVAIAHHSLEHVVSPLRVLCDLQSKLKPGGVLIVVVPIDDWRTQKRYDPNDPNHHLYTWTPLTLGNLLAEAGFDMSTLAITLGVNGWFRAFPKLYRRLPGPFGNLLLRLWASIRRTREIRAVIRTRFLDVEHKVI